MLKKLFTIYIRWMNMHCLFWFAKLPGNTGMKLLTAPWWKNCCILVCILTKITCYIMQSVTIVSVVLRMTMGNKWNIWKCSLYAHDARILVTPHRLYTESLYLLKMLWWSVVNYIMNCVFIWPVMLMLFLWLNGLINCCCTCIHHSVL